MANEEDPKEVARKERKMPGVERLLRQFLTDGPKGATEAYKEGHERAFGTEKRRTRECCGRPVKIRITNGAEPRIYEECTVCGERTYRKEDGW